MLANSHNRNSNLQHFKYIAKNETNSTRRVARIKLRFTYTLMRIHVKVKDFLSQLYSDNMMTAQ